VLYYSVLSLCNRASIAVIVVGSTKTFGVGRGMASLVGVGNGTLECRVVYHFGIASIMAVAIVSVDIMATHAPC
jgi:hypothetical protein